MDAKVDDQNAALKLLCLLPPSYNSSRDAMLYGKDSVISNS